MAIGETIKKILSRELGLVREFITTPKGVFETIDESIKIVREELQLIKKILRT